MEVVSRIQAQLTAAGLTEPAHKVVAGLLVAAVLVSCTPCSRQRRRNKDDEDGPQPAWEWFFVSNIVAVAGFIGSVTYLFDYWMINGSEHAAAFAFTQPAFVVSLVVALACLLYFFAFCGVAFVYKDVTEWMQSSERAAAAAAETAAGRWPEAQADVVIVGLGLAGSALATVLARQGKKVLVIERSKELYETIKGELLQPGGVRCLERMGLASTCKAAEVDPVRVDGYVCIQPGGQEIILTYPNRDPKDWYEFLGLGPSDGFSGKIPAKLSSGTGETEVDARTNEDIHPRGRSFYNTRFVQQLRNCAEAEPNVQIVWGSVRKLVSAREAAAAGAGSKDTHHGLPSWAQDTERIVGVAWMPNDGDGKERMSLAPLTVVADGMYSALRPAVHSEAPKTISYFCGVLLKHPDHETPLPHPNRGHVVMTDPNPVLFYQISSCETRVLVDVPAKMFSDDTDKVKQYFRENIAPQLPECLRKPFLDATNEQEPICMPNKALSGASPTKHGVVMVGDTLNMRHPLTGGGMTVALRDVELIANTLKKLSFVPGKYNEKKLETAIATFQARRSAHASTINILAIALYRVFCKPANDAAGTRGRLRDACIAYLGLGGACSAGPVGLLSGLTPEPYVLVMHFFAVAAHAMKTALLPFPSPTRLREGYDLLHIACIIIMPLVTAEKVTALSNPFVAGALDLLFPWKNVDPSALS